MLLPPLCSLQTLPYILFHSPPKAWSFFFINYYCIYIYIHICICLYRYILKYNLLSPYNVTCMCVFRTDCLALDNQLVCSSLGNNTIFSFPKFTRLLAVQCVRLCSHAISLPTLAFSLVSSFFNSHLGGHVGENLQE